MMIILPFDENWSKGKNGPTAVISFQTELPPEKKRRQAPITPLLPARATYRCGVSVMASFAFAFASSGSIQNFV